MTSLPSYLERPAFQYKLSKAKAGSVVQPEPYVSPFEFRNAADTLHRLRDAEVVLSGPAGTGKTLANLDYLHGCAWDYPRMRALIVRKTRVSLSESALVTYEKHILLHKKNAARFGSICLGATRHFRQVYRYPNGSEIAVGGMDNPTRIMSTEFDMIYVPELIELSLAEYESLLTRLRNGVMPYQQMIADTNPDVPRHWIKLRQAEGKLTLLETRHEDNPALYTEDGELTEYGRAYMAKLDALSGVRKLRLRDGQWVQAEGVIFDTFDEVLHVKEDADYNPALGSVFWFCDDGYADGKGVGTQSYHPRVVLFAQYTPVGGVQIFDEYYRTGESSYKQTIDECVARGWPEPEACYVDSAAPMFRGSLIQAGYYSVGATHNVENGIYNVQRMLGEKVEGVPLLRIHPRCVELVREFQSYRREGNRILRIDDHGPSAVRYGTWRLRHGG